MNCIFTLLILAAISLSAQEPIDTNGNGYRNISTLEQLRWISENDSSWTWNYELDNDIDASDTRNWNDGKGWSPIGNGMVEFTGNINGNGYVISNIFANRPDESAIAFIGVANNATIINFHLFNCDFTGNFNVSSLMAYSSYENKILFCSATGRAEGKQTVAGLVAYNGGNIENSYAQVDVEAERTVSGFVANNISNAKILNCYSAGIIEYESKPVGGFVVNNNGKVENCFWDSEVSGINTSHGGVGKTTSDMHKQETFEISDWNFMYIWSIKDSYPEIDFISDFYTEPIDENENGFLDIKSLSNLLWIIENKESWSWDYELLNDIDASGIDTVYSIKGWKPLGDTTTPFTGSILGHGHTISNLKINRPKASYVAFISVGKDIKIEDLHIYNCDIKGQNYVSSLVSIIGENCVIKYCSAIGQIEGNNNVGGLVAENSGFIHNSYSRVNISSNNSAAGFVNSNLYSGRILYCYSAGKIASASNQVGGFIEFNEGIVANCFWDREAGEISESNGGESKTTSEMKTKATYEYANWNFDNIWEIGTGYPFLKTDEDFEIAPKDDDNNGYINVKNFEDLLWIAINKEFYDKNFELDNDIDASETKKWEKGWRPIGNAEYQFTGMINGSGFSIDNLYINTPNLDYVGLIGYTTSRSIQDITLNNCDITGNDYVGALAGYSPNCSFNNCVINGSVSGNDYVGGLTSTYKHIYSCKTEGNIMAVGDYTGGLAAFSQFNENYINSISVNNSISNMNIIGNDYVGGIVGWNKMMIDSSTYTGNIQGENFVGGICGKSIGAIFNSNALGSIEKSKQNAGGIVGVLGDQNSKINTDLEAPMIIQSTSEMDIIGQDKVGGLAGNNILGIIKYSSSSGTVEGIKYTGGFVGVNNGNIADSYSHSNVTGVDTVGGFVGYHYKSEDKEAIIFNTYSIGKVSGTTLKGGFSGKNNANVIMSFWDINNSGQTFSDAGDGKSTEEMKDISTYLNSHWNFNFVWNIDDSYPFIDIRKDNAPTDTDGNGYINIKNLNDLRWFSESNLYLDKNWELDNDIDASETKYWNGGRGFNPIGKMHYAFDLSNITYGKFHTFFTGSFNGNGHTISNIFINLEKSDDVGFFSVACREIKNLNLLNITVVGNDYTGGLAGYYIGTDYDISALNRYQNTKVTNCNVTGVIEGNDYVGGIFGGANGCDLKFCNTDVEIKANNVSGGLLGYLSGGIRFIPKVKFSYSNGSVEGNEKLGGLIGSTSSSQIISGYSDSDVIGNKIIGGLIGSCNSDIMGCYSTGKVIGKEETGGLVGVKHRLGNRRPIIINGFWDYESSGIKESAGGIGIPTAEMQNKDFFLNEGWNFDFIWDIEGEYPFIDLKEEMRPEDTDGNGYLNIKNLTDLRWLSETDLDLDKNWELDNDINAGDSKNWLSGLGFEPIGDSLSAFTGKFDGNGFLIENIHINRPTQIYIGFFARTTDSISNLGLKNIYVNGLYHLGGLSAESSGDITNCLVSGELRSDTTYVYHKFIGGLVGNNNENVINLCNTNIKISAKTLSHDYMNVGGLIGRNQNGTIKKSYSLGEISINHSFAGGLIGLNEGNVKNSFSKVDFMENGKIAGLVSLNYGLIENCYATGKLQSNHENGGLALFNSIDKSEILNSFWDIETSEQTKSSGGTGKTTAEMKTKSTFTDAGWDFDEIWYISPTINDGYPFFIGVDTIPSAVVERLISYSDISIHPNPASDYIEISLGSHSVNKGLQPLVHGREIAIYDVLGERVMTVETHGHASLQRIDISHLPRGVYFVRFGERVEKFVKH